MARVCVGIGWNVGQSKRAREINRDRQDELVDLGNLREKTMKLRSLLLLSLALLIVLPMMAQAVPRTVIAEMGSATW